MQGALKHNKKLENTQNIELFNFEKFNLILKTYQTVLFLLPDERSNVLPLIFLSCCKGENQLNTEDTIGT